jgi:glycosyltransferase involved in cell wall biosynthesis
MSDALTVSIVIVSRHRPEALRRCLTGVAQLMYHPFEVVVVADPDSCTAMRDLPQAAHAKLLACDSGNISAARNIGIESAAGEIVAFLDDVSVPEPTWLHFLIAPLARQDVAAAGGFVRGRNGISFQSKAEWVDRTGKTGPIALAGKDSVMLSPTRERAIRTVATNMALRRSVLADIGGFDPGFRTTLGDTDLNLRLADLGLCTAIAPLAQVHRGDEDLRRAKGVARDLSDLGESWAVFLRKHCDDASLPDLLRRLKADQRRRTLTWMIDGYLEPRDVRRLMQSFDTGWRAGLAQERGRMPRLAHPKEPFRPFVWQKLGPASVLSGRVWSRSRLRTQALAKNGLVTVIRLSPTALFHKVRFTKDGYWEQTGGMFGKSERTQPLISFWTFRRRVRWEIDRVRDVRGLE